MIKLAKNLTMPLSGVTQKFAFLGRTGSGKTYGSGKLAEEMLLHGAQIIALDVVGNWYALRIPKDKRNKPFDLHIFGGQHGDIEINPKAGKIVAGIIIEKNLSAVVDISEFISSEQTRFAYDFLTELFERRKQQPAACHVFIEEAQELVPQNLPPAQRGSDNFAARMLHAGERLLKIGRNYGIGATIITQRPQDVNKKVLNQTEVLLAFQMTGLQERKTISDWIREKGQDENLADQLPKLETGHALVWSPAWLKISGTFKIAEKITADVSATPEVGVDAPETQRLEPRDVSELSDSIKALTAEMEANTPAALKKRIAELEKQLKAATASSAELKEIEVIKEVPVLPDELRTDLDKVFARLTQHTNALGEIFTNFGSTLEQVKFNHEDIRSLVGKYRDLPSSVPANGHLKNARQTATNWKSMPNATPFRKEHPASSVASTNGNAYRDHLNQKQRAMIDTVLTFERLGRPAVDRAIVATFAGMSAKSGSFGVYLGALRNGKPEQYPAMIDYVPGGVGLTDAGRGTAESTVEIHSISDLHDAWKAQIKTPKQIRMLEVVIARHPLMVPRLELAEAADMSPTSGSFGVYIGALRSLGLIDYVKSDGESYVKATDLLFPEGLN